MPEKDLAEDVKEKRGKFSDPLPNFPNTSYSRIMNDLNSEYKDLENGYNTAKSARLKAYNEYTFRPYGNEKAGQSRMVDSTIFNVVEWMVPAILQPFVETDSFVDISSTSSDVEQLIAADVHKELLDYQIKRKIPIYQILYDTIKSFLIQSESFVKVTWKKKSKIEPTGRPVVSVVPASQIRYDWTVQNFLDSSVVTQDEDMTKTDIINLMENVGGLIKNKFYEQLEKIGRNSKTARLMDEVREQSNFVGEKRQRSEALSLLLRREQWTSYDVHGTGKAVPILAVFIDDVLVQVIENPMPFKTHPFVMAQCVRGVLGNPAFSWAEVLSDVQKFRTSILRLMSDNLNSQHNGIYEVDVNNVDDVGMMLLRKAPSGSRVPVPVTKPGSINPLTPAPIASQAFQVWELMQVVAENMSGFTRYSQGNDSNSLNQTATGISQIMQRSDMRMWELSIRFSEMFLTPLVRMLIQMNQTFLDEQDLEVQFGVRGFEKAGIEPIKAKEWITLDKKDLGGFFDVKVDIKTRSDKQQTIDNLLQFAQFFSGSVGQGVSKQLLELVSVEAAKAMGLKKVEHLLGENNAGSGKINIPSDFFGTGGNAQGQPQQAPDTGNGSIPTQPDSGVQGIDINQLLGNANQGAPDQAITSSLTG